MRPRVPFKWRGIHHGYLGGFFFVPFGVFFLFMNWGNMLPWLNVLYSLFIVCGLVIVVDDVIEHTVTEDTPCRLLWEMVVK